jgi:hypothetical protein
VSAKRIDEDGQPGTPGDIREIDAKTAREAVVYRMPLRLPFSRGRRRWLVIRAYMRTARVTLSVE